MIYNIFFIGYSALFRHPNNELNYCVYLIPGNPQVTNDTLPYWHNHLIKNDPNILKSLGANPKMERMRVGMCICTYICVH